MIENWLSEIHRIHLPKLFEHLGYRPALEEKTHYIYQGNGGKCVVIHTEKGFLYYKVQRPQEKLSASDLITAHVSKTGDLTQEMLWDKVDHYYNMVLQTKSLLITHNPEHGLKTVSVDFNHFVTYGLPMEKDKEGLYADSVHLPPFSGRIFQNGAGEPLFPLFNLQNEVCGYFVDTDKGVLPFKESAIEHSLWYSNIPKSIKGLFLFKEPKEALAFHKTFQLKNVVYMALGDINSQATDILFQIQRLTKVGKLFLSFTGNRKIEGYLRDLHFITHVKDSGFKMVLTDRDIVLRFPMGNEKSFTRFYDHTRRFNKELAQSFLKYNKTIDQNRLNKYSIMVSKEEEDIKVRLPLEANAIKLFVWSYYKNYLDRSIEVLKPTSNTWYSEWKSTENRSQKGKEVQWKDYRIAM